MKRIVHVAEIPITEETGMGRIAWHWQEAFERAGWEFVHIGPDETRRPPHKALWHFRAWERFEREAAGVSAVLVHEPVSGIFTRRFRGPVVLFSHGIEPRGEIFGERAKKSGVGTAMRRLAAMPLWSLRKRQCKAGLRWADLALLSNREDVDYVRNHIHRRGPVFVFRNGCDLRPPAGVTRTNEVPVALFFASWLYRKGADVLVEAAGLLARRGITPRWILAGTGRPEEEVLAAWPPLMRDRVKVLPRLSRQEEKNVYEQADIFVLPSRFEGQPLTLLQAMAQGLCCVTTNCCGQRDVIEHLGNGLLVPVGSPEALAEALARVISDEQLRSRLGEKASCDVAGRAWDVVSDEVVNEVMAIIQQKAGKGHNERIHR